MRKILIYIFAAYMLISGSAAYAAEYNTQSNSITGITDNTYRTIVVVKYDDENGEYDYNNIIYVDQLYYSTYSSGAQFMLRNAPEEGKYALLLGGFGPTEKLEFYIGHPVGYMDKDSDHKWQTDETVSFAWDALNLSEYNSVIITAGEMVYCVALSEFSMPIITDGNVSVGLQLTDIPEGVEVNASLSKGVLSDNTLDVSEAYTE